MYLFDPSRSGGVESGEWRVGSEEWRVESGEWRAESGERRVENGEWRTGSGERRVENGEWRTGGGRTKKKRSPKGLRFVVGVGGGVRTHDLQIHNLAL